MTFTHGDYSRVEAIKGKEETAEKLYEKSLEYHPDHRAYLGLAIMTQKRGDFHESMKVLKEGIRYFPESEALHLCQGINLMNLREFEEAISCFMKFPDSEEAVPYISKCYEALGYPKKASILLKDT